MKSALFLLALPLCAQSPMRTVTLPSQSPVVTLKLVFTTGSVVDPPTKPGVATLTAAMLTSGGTRELTSQQVTDALFPLAANVGRDVDNEMTSFSGSAHIDTLDAYYKLFRAMLLDPGWRPEDFKRLKDAAINNLKVGLRGNNDEELGKEVLQSQIYRGTPYANYHGGTLSALEAITLDDVKLFYKQHYTQSNLIIGLAGGYPATFLDQIKKDFSSLPKQDPTPLAQIKPAEIPHTHLTIVEKNTRSVAYSFGFPLDVRRGAPDFPALLLMQSYLGPHRMSGGRLFQRIREIRGINYGDYAYIEYFPRGSNLMEPPTNIARRSQIFQIWIRPAEPPQAAFTLRLAAFELNKLIQDGISQQDFDRTKEFLSKYVNVLTKTKRAELGYAIDSLYYGTPEYTTYIKSALATLTRDQVNAALRRHLHADRLQIVAVSNNAAALAQQLLGDGPSPISYNSPKPADVLTEDKLVERYNLTLRPEDIEILPVEKVFQ